MTKLAHFFLKKAGLCKKIEKYHPCTKRDTRNNAIFYNRMLLVKKGFVETATIASAAAAIALFLGISAGTSSQNISQPQASNGSVLAACIRQYTASWSPVSPGASVLYFDWKVASWSNDNFVNKPLSPGDTQTTIDVEGGLQYHWRLYVQVGEWDGGTIDDYYHVGGPTSWNGFSTASCPAEPPPPPPPPPPTTNPPPPPAPVTVTPAKLNPNVNQECAPNEPLVNITFSWTPASGATFDLQYIDINTTGQEPWDVGTQLNVVQKFVKIDNIAHKTKIYWRINTHVKGGDWYPSEVSSVDTKDCSPATPPPAPSAPADPTNLSFNRPNCIYEASYSQVVTWEEVADAQTYFVRVDYGARGILDQDVGNFTKHTIPDLYPNESYFWAVSAWNANGISPGVGKTIPANDENCPAAPESPPAGGTPTTPPAQPPSNTPPPAPSSVRFVNSDCRDSGFGPLPVFTFSWTQVSSADGYWFDTSQNSNFVPFSNKQIVGGSNTTFTWDLEHPMEDGSFPDNGKPYYFRVTSYNAAGVYIPQTVGTTSVARDCTTGTQTPTEPPPEELPIYIPSPTATPAKLNTEYGQTCVSDTLVNITFSWTPATGATFDDQYIDINTTGQEPWGTGTQLDVGQSFTTIANIAHKTTIYWRINTHVEGGGWEPSDVLGFTTDFCGGAPAPPADTPTPIACNAPGTFSLKDPSGVIKDPFPSFQWTDATGENFYIVDLSQDGFATWWHSPPLGQNITTTPWSDWNSESASGPAELKFWGGLPPGEDFQWRVAAFKTCPDGNKFTHSQAFSMKYVPQSPIQLPTQIFAAQGLNTGPKNDGFGLPGLVGSYDPTTGINGYFDWQYDTRNNIHSFIKQVVYLKHDNGQVPDPTNALKVGEFDKNVQTFPLTGLTPNQAHAWNIYTCADQACNSNAKSPVAKFETIGIPKDQPTQTPPPDTIPGPPQASLPTSPVLNAPVNGATYNLNDVNNLIFTWQDPKGNATNYWLDISQSEDFAEWIGCNTTQTVVGYKQCPSKWEKFKDDGNGGTNLGADTPFEDLSGTYYWRVAAANDAGFSLAPSETRRFSVVTQNPTPEVPIPPRPPSEPTPPEQVLQREAELGIISDENCTADGKVSLTFNWKLGEPSPYILRQWIDVAPNKDFAGDYHATTNPPEYGSNFYQTGTLSTDPDRLGWQIPHLEPNTKYYWRINTYFADVPNPYPTVPAQFKTRADCAPAAPSLVLSRPENLTSASICDTEKQRPQVGFAWNKVEGATGYFVDISQTDTYNQLGVDYHNVQVAASELPGFTWDKDHLIRDREPFPNLGYFWRVYAYKDTVENGIHSLTPNKKVFVKNDCGPQVNIPAKLGEITDQSCTSDRKVSVVFHWDKGSPDSLIVSQWIDVKIESKSFDGKYHSTTLPPNVGTNFYKTGTPSTDPGHLGWQIPPLEPKKPYYWRINTLFKDDSDWKESEPKLLDTIDCPQPEPPQVSGPKLIITALSLDSTNLAPNTQAKATITIKNVGGQKTTNYWTQVYPNSPNEVGCETTNGGIYPGAVEPNQEITTSANFTTPSEGNYTLRAFVDATCQFANDLGAQQKVQTYTAGAPQVPTAPEPLSFTSPAIVPPSNFICDPQISKWSATFKWLPGYVIENGQERFAAEEQRIDWKSEKISGWTPGSYSIAGPFGANINSSILENIEPNNSYVWRVANLYNGAWYHSGEQTFTTESCGPKDFQVLIAEKTLQVEPGASTTYSIQFDYTSGWNEKINLSPANGQPITEPSITASYDPPSSSTLDRSTSVVKLKLQTNQATPQNKYDFEIKACSTSNICRTSSSTLEVKKVNVPTGTIFPKCGNRWTDSAPPPGIYIGNFAVPNCDYDLDALYSYMFSYGRSVGISDANINFFFSPVIKLESGYYPNVTAPAINGIAYGLFQWTVPAEWHKQVQYAFNYFQEHRQKAGSPFYCGWGYWQAARENPVENKWTPAGCL